VDLIGIFIGHQRNGRAISRLLKKTHMLRCAQSPRSNVLDKYASARRFFARLASEIFLSSLQSEFFTRLGDKNIHGPRGATHCRPRREHRSERAHDRRAAMTSRDMAIRSHFFLGSALHHSSSQASSRHRPIARDRRGSLLGSFTVSDSGRK
jgi:hypothetical protein